MIIVINKKAFLFQEGIICFTYKSNSSTFPGNGMFLYTLCMFLYAIHNETKNRQHLVCKQIFSGKKTQDAFRFRV